jgi:hypothetical protein
MIEKGAMKCETASRALLEEIHKYMSITLGDSNINI